MTVLQPGRITAVDDAALTATLVDEAGQAHDFTQAEWDGVGRPQRDADVLFRLRDGRIDLVGLAESRLRRRLGRVRRGLGAGLGLLFSYRGRIGRARLSLALFGVWLPILIAIAVVPKLIYGDEMAAAMRQLTAAPNEPLTLSPGYMRMHVTVLMIIGLFWISVVGLALRRVRDLGLSGWWLLLPLAIGMMVGTIDQTLGTGVFIAGMALLVLALLVHPTRAAAITDAPLSDPTGPRRPPRVPPVRRKRRDR